MKSGVDYIGVSVGAFIINDRSEVLLMKRSQNAKNEKGKWEAPGGAVEFGEKLEDAIRREMREELGIEIDILKQWTAKDHIIPEDKQHWVPTTFLVKVAKGYKPENIEQAKHDAIGWFSIENFPEPLSIITKINVIEYRKLQQTENIKKGVYQHYKGKKYRLLDIVRHSESLEEMVLYEALYDNNLGNVWVRPKKMFFETLIIDGKKVKRFTFLGV